MGTSMTTSTAQRTKTSMDRLKNLGRAPALALRRAGAADDEEVEVAHMEMKAITEITIAKMTASPHLVVVAVGGEETREEMVAAVCRRQLDLRTATARIRRALEVLEILRRVFRK